MIEAIRSSETSVLTKNTRRKIPENGFLHSHRCENFKSYIIYHIFAIFSAMRFFFFWGGGYVVKLNSQIWHTI
jgi:hypothetical protein